MFGLLGMLRFQRRERFVQELVELLVVLGRIGLKFAPEFRRDLEVEGGVPGRIRAGGRISLRLFAFDDFPRLRRFRHSSG